MIMYDPKACEHEAKEEKNVYCQRNSELRRLAGAMHCQIWVTRSVYMQFEAEDYRKIGFALYDYITLGYSQCSIDIINTKAIKDCTRLPYHQSKNELREKITK